jgi:alkylhydroperoxidase/carboxymuconolactone decarboxylase family protein YurZ
MYRVTYTEKGKEVIKYEGTLNDCIEFMIERARNNEGANGETHLEIIKGRVDG